jgi:L-lactate utilization protein LutC
MAEEWARLADDATLERTRKALQARGIQTALVKDRAEALAWLLKTIPAGGQVMTTSSTTLEEIGFIDLLKSGTHPWRNFKERILAEKDTQKQNELRALSTSVDYYLGSVHAVAETGEVVVASNSGSQLPAYAFNSPHVLWVVGAQKVAKDLESAIRRVRTYVLPLEDARARKAYGAGSSTSKILIIEKEVRPGRLTLLLVKEKLGF